MKNTALKSLVVVCICAVALGIFLCPAWPEVTSGSVVYVDQNKGFVVIDVGQDDGAYTSAVFDVYRQSGKIATIKAVKVRRKFSAADIQTTYSNNAIAVGDIVYPVHSVALAEPRQLSIKDNLTEAFEPIFGLAERYIAEQSYDQAEDTVNEILERDPENERAQQLLERIRLAILNDALSPLFAQAQMYIDALEYDEAETTLQEILELDPQNKEADKLFRSVKRDIKAKTADLAREAISIEINAPKEAILSTAINVFNEYGCLITFSDPDEFNLEANKHLELPLIEGIVTDYAQFTRNKIYYSVDIQQSPLADLASVNRLVISLRAVYDTEGTITTHEIGKKSSVYKEAEKMAFTIKHLAEQL
ncbi:MAG: hypothetical protein V1727_00790 [Candidatus Omnitrophota bacterium]